MASRLPVADPLLAAALLTTLGTEGLTLGKPEHYLDTAADRGWHTFFLEGSVSRAALALESWQQKQTGPADPLRAVICAVRTVSGLMAWLRGEMPSLVADGAFLVLARGPSVSVAALPPGEVAIPLRSPDAIARIEAAALDDCLRRGLPLPPLPHHVAAAAIVCGFLPLRITGTAEAPVLHLTAASVRDGLTFAALQTHLEGRLLPPLDPEHPFHYAYEGIRHYAGLCRARGLTGQNPLHVYRKEDGSGGGALVSQSLLEEGHPLDFGTKLDQHLAGVL